ncbi:MAG: amino acid permease [Lentisphaerae bacterium]|nr:amino acid permease [Lentisphaerota bacterium]
MAEKTTTPEDVPPVKFNAFGGVFTPSLLTILGVIMYLRFAAVVGHAGLWGTLAILAGATLISLITALSIASIATNMRVKGGGVYYLISRSLGVEFGGVIAVFFYVAQAVAVTMYVMGFSEALFSAFPGLTMSFRELATMTNLAVFLCVYIGAGWTIRLQYVILGVIILSLLSFFIGAGLAFDPTLLRANLAPRWTPGYGFFAVFALFFPAVTGIMAGVNMSGDLREPSRAIPRGTFAAVGVSTLIYVAICIMLAVSVPRGELVSGGFVLKDRALYGPLIYAGVICATISSALGSMMGAPRILQALARDNIFKRIKWFGRGSGRSGEPRRAIILTFLIAQGGIMAGDLDTIAPVITMFFLMTYGTVNLACFYEMRANNPSFRPKFRLHNWSVALLGALGCLGVMFLINPLAAAVAMVLSGSLYFLIARAEVLVKWGDLGSGLAYQRARTALLKMENERYHPKNWRPSILALSGGAYNRLHLSEYACWLTADSGIVSIAQVIIGAIEDLMKRWREAESLLRKFIREQEIAAFPVVVVEKDIHAAIQALLQCHGLGGTRPNTVLLGWSNDPEKAGMFSAMLGTIKRMHRSIVIVACEWWADAENGALMLLLAYLLKKNPDWRDRPLRIIRTTVPKADIGNIAREMRQLLADSRIDAELVILATENALAAVRRAMAPSAVLFAGFAPVDDDPSGEWLTWLHEVVGLPGDVLLVYNTGDAALGA